MKKTVCSLVFFIGFTAFSQNKQVLYDFAELPQTLLLNPGAETNYKFHIGVPLLSGISTEVGITGFALTDLFLSDTRSINDKVAEVLSQLKSKDYVKSNTQVEVLSGGFRYKDKTYFSFGFYEEIDAIGYFPTDIITLLNEGNAAYLNRNFSFSQLIYKVDALGVLHAGITKKVNNKLTVGGRFKVYSSSLNVETNNNTGTFTTTLGNNTIYTHYLDNINLNFKTSGLIENGEYVRDESTYIKNSFLGGNLGVGFDVGFTYHISKQLELTGSMIDIGFIHHKKNIKNSFVTGTYIFEGIEFLYDDTNPNYWGDINVAFKEKIARGDNNNSYISWRPTKINASLKHSFGEIRSKICYDNTHKDFYSDAIGIQLYSVFRPLRPQLEVTGFYRKSFSNKLHTKFTYTIDDYSFYNIGAGISGQIGKINMYGMIDNILQLHNITSANSTSLQVGINLIFN